VPLTRRQIYRRRRIAVFGAIVLALGLGIYLPTTLLAPLPLAAAEVLPYEPPTGVAPAPATPGYGASALGAVGYDGALVTSGAAEALPIASITKVLTALVVTSVHPLAEGEAGPSITMGAADEQFYSDQLAEGGGVKSVYAGQVVTQRQMLELVLIASANNYAESLATWAFGSEQGFLDATRAWLDERGLVSPIITDPSGILPTNVSTSADLLEIAKLAIADPTISTIVATVETVVPDVGTIRNTNDLLGIDGVDGIKTGTLDESGACLLFSSDLTVGDETVTLVGVVLGGPDHGTIDADIQSLLATATPGFQQLQLVTAGQQVASFTTPWGDQANAVAVADESALVWSDTPVAAFPQIDDVNVGDAGTDVGEVRFTVGERTVVVQLELDAPITDPGSWWRVTNPTEVL
jgi:serine-type D-Ala-D-Ala carboxypeptidase (penicillin-binding protein 5/6)